MDLTSILENKSILDKIVKYLGNVIATHANKNLLITKCESINDIDNIISNINSTLAAINTDDPVLTTKLTEYKIKKEEEKEQLLNGLITEIITPEDSKKTKVKSRSSSYSSSYSSYSGGCGSSYTTGGC